MVPVRLDYPLLKATVHVHAAWQAFIAAHKGVAAAVYTGVRVGIAILSLPLLDCRPSPLLWSCMRQHMLPLHPQLQVVRCA